MATPPALHIEPLARCDGALASRLQALWERARAQEAAWLGLGPDVAAVPLPAAAHHLGAFGEGALVGLLGLDADDGLPGHIRVRTLVVEPAVQRRGIARALLGDAFRRGAGAGFTVLAAAGNAPALALYHGLGFAVCRQGGLGDGGVPVLLLRRPPGAAA